MNKPNLNQQLHSVRQGITESEKQVFSILLTIRRAKSLNPPRLLFEIEAAEDELSFLMQTIRQTKSMVESINPKGTRS
jgi:hypothetical protein